MMWQTRLGQCIFTHEKKFSIYQNILYRWLTFQTPAIQTLICRKFPEYPVLKYIKALTIPVRTVPGDCYLLGLGGGAVAHHLSPYLKPYRFLAIEKEPAIIDMAQTYFMVNRLRHLSIQQQDAHDFLKHEIRPCQHLIIDLFDAQRFPKNCLSTDFFHHCYRILSPDGFLAINLVHDADKGDILNKLTEFFKSHLVFLPIPKTSNVVILAYKGQTINPLLTLIKHNSTLKQLVWQSSLGYVAHF